MHLTFGLLLGATSAPAAAPPAPTAPVVSSITVTDCSLAGAASATINGSGFTGASKATFGATDQNTVTVVSDTQITCAIPAKASAGAVALTVTTATGGTSAPLAAAVTYHNPTLSGISVAGGPSGGGTAVTLTGTYLNGASKATFGTTDRGTISVASDGLSATCSTPAVSAALVSVTITVNGVASSALSNAFRFCDPPVISSLSVVEGPLAGSTATVITGSGFYGVAATGFTLFGSGVATYTVDSPTQITVSATPSGSAGAVAVYVTGYGGQGSKSSAFTYLNAPTVTACTPDIGDTGGKTITVSGLHFTGFAGAISVTVNGTAATGVSVSNDTTLTCTTPSLVLSKSAVNVVVATPGGSSAASNALFTPWDPVASTLFAAVFLSGLGYSYGTGTMQRTGTGGTCTLTGTAVGNPEIYVECTTGGALNTWKFKWSKDGGSTFEETGCTSASTYVLGSTGLTLNIGSGTAVLGVYYKSTCHSWLDQTANANNATASSASYEPLIRTTTTPCPSLYYAGTQKLQLTNRIAAGAVSVFVSGELDTNSSAKVMVQLDGISIDSCESGFSGRWGAVVNAGIDSGQTMGANLMVAEVIASAANHITLRTNGENGVTRTNGASWQSNTANYIGVTHIGAIKSVLIAASALSDSDASLTRRYLGARDAIAVAA